MSSLDDLFQHILQEPLDDALRLLYADLCEENGELDRAQLIRLQIALYERMYLQKNVDLSLFPSAEIFQETNLLLKVAPRATGITSLLLLQADPGSLFLSDNKILSGSARSVRGFMGWVSVSAYDWLTCGPQIVQRHPVEDLRLRDIKPVYAEGRSAWGWRSTRHAITPSGIRAGVLPHCWLPEGGHWEDTKIDESNSSPLGRALDFADQRALNWARKKAGQPELGRRKRRGRGQP